MNGRFDDLAQHAAAHHGLFRSSDAARFGVSRQEVRTLVGSGWCEVLRPGVYRVAAAPATGRQALLAEVWSHPKGAVVSHRAAGYLHLLVGFRVPRPEVTLPFGQNQRGRHCVHVSLRLPAAHLVIRDSIPTTSVARTLFDLAGVEPKGRVEVALDDALARRLCTLRQVNQVFFALARRGRRGSAAMRELMEDRGEGYVPPASALERLARKVIADHALPPPQFEVHLGDEEWIGRVDCVWPEARLIVELDGARFHSSKSRREADRVRDNRLMAAGWRVLRLTWDDLVSRPAEVAAQIAAALRSAA